MNKKMLEYFFTSQYGAVLAHPAMCSHYLEGGACELLAGFSFRDPAVNYTLLSDTDFLAFPPELVKNIHNSGESPFSDMLLIFYRNEKGISYKLINGMAGKLLALADRFCIPDGSVLD